MSVQPQPSDDCSALWRSRSRPRCVPIVYADKALHRRFGIRAPVYLLLPMFCCHHLQKYVSKTRVADKQYVLSALVPISCPHTNGLAFVYRAAQAGTATGPTESQTAGFPAENGAALTLPAATYSPITACLAFSAPLTRLPAAPQGAGAPLSLQLTPLPDDQAPPAGRWLQRNGMHSY